METPKFRIYNQTRERFLGPEVILVDASEEHVESRIESLAFQAQAGLWLKPFRELHPAHVLPLFDMVYLDEEFNVLQEIELYPGFNVEPLTMQPASALVLPMGSILASRLQTGDCVAIRALEQVENAPPELPAETTSEPFSQDTPLPLEDVPEAGDSFAALITETAPEPVAQNSPLPAEELPEVEAVPAKPLLKQPRGGRRLRQKYRPKRRLPLRHLPSKHTGRAQNAIQSFNRDGNRRTRGRAPGPPGESLVTRILRRFDDAVRGLGPEIERLKARLLLLVNEAARTLGPRSEQATAQLLRLINETARTLGSRTKRWKTRLRCWLEETARDLGPKIEQGRAHVLRWVDETGRSLGPTAKEWKTRFLRWLDEKPASNPVDRRQARRMPLPPLVAFYWTGGAPQPYHLGDISTVGTYLRTRDRSSPGTIFLVTLQKTDSNGEHSGDAISIYAKVVRWGDDGVGLQFIPSKPTGHSTRHTGVDNPADQGALTAFLRQLKRHPELVPQ